MSNAAKTPSSVDGLAASHPRTANLDRIRHPIHHVPPGTSKASGYGFLLSRVPRASQRGGRRARAVSRAPGKGVAASRAPGKGVALSWAPGEGVATSRAPGEGVEQVGHRARVGRQARVSR
jgi:hypothetical protein